MVFKKTALSHSLLITLEFPDRIQWKSARKIMGLGVWRVGVKLGQIGFHLFKIYKLLLGVIQKK